MRARPKNVLLLLIFLVAVPLFWMSFVIKQDDSSDILVEQKLLEMKERLQFAENLNKIREHDLKVLQSQFKFMVNAQSQPGDESHRSTNESVLRDMQRALQNFSRNDNHNRLYIPSIFSYLPHLVGDDGSVKPAYKVSRNRVGVSMVFGVPTVKRLKESYLIPTLEHLVSGLDESEQEDALIVVFIAEPYDQDYVKTVGKEIQNKLPDSVKTGLIEIVSPPATFYPDMDKLRLTLGDPPERVKWRTKQNLDFAFLMLYAKNRGLYYTQLEDDVIAKPGYLSTMKSFAFNQKNDNWMVLEFSQLGFIGKMFKSQDLPLFAEFFVMFHNDKPVDWLLDNLMYVKFCSPEKSPTHCRKVIADIRRRYKPSLFQHVGIHSSLKGKTQKLKDKDFGKQDTNLIRSHHNPPAEVRTSLTVYQKYTLDKAYMGQTIFWGLTPEAEDTVEFHLRPPLILYGYLFRSGNREHPGDRFANTSVEILPASHINDNGAILENVPGEKIYPEGDKGFLVLGHFNEKGLAQGPIDPRVGEVAVIRLHALTKSDSWVILSEIMLQTTKQS